MIIHLTKLTSGLNADKMNPDLDKDSDLYSDDFDHFEIQVNIN